MSEWRSATWLSAARPVGVVAVALTVLVAAAASPGPAYADHGEGKALRPLLVEHVEELAFGLIMGDPILPGQVVIDPVTGTKKVSGGAVDMGGDHSRAEFLVRGEPGHSIVITLPGEHKISSSSSGAKGTTLITDFASDPENVGKLGPDGQVIVYVGATFNLKPGQKGDKYQSPLDIIVDYQ